MEEPPGKSNQGLTVVMSNINQSPTVSPVKRQREATSTSSSPSTKAAKTNGLTDQEEDLSFTEEESQGISEYSTGQTTDLLLTPEITIPEPEPEMTPQDDFEYQRRGNGGGKNSHKKSPKHTPTKTGKTYSTDKIPLKQLQQNNIHNKNTSHNSNNPNNNINSSTITTNQNTENPKQTTQPTNHIQNNNVPSFASVAAPQETPDQPEKRFAGSMNLTSSLSALNEKFQYDIFVRDLIKQFGDDFMKNIVCVGHRDKSEIEVVFKPGAKTLMMKLQTQGLNSHNTNMSFKPDVGDSTSVTFFGIPHELGDEVANKYISKYGQIVYHFRHKKRYDKHVIFTGRRIYRINLTKPIPKHVFIAGHRCNTVYTNQDQDLAQQQQEEAVEAEKKQREAEEMRQKAHKMKTLNEEQGEVFVPSFLHPDLKDLQPADQWERDVLATREAISIATKVNKLYVTKPPPNSNNPKQYIDRLSKTPMTRHKIQTQHVIAMVEAGGAVTAKLPPGLLSDQEKGYRYVRGFSLLAQFGYRKDFESCIFDKDTVPDDVVELWKDFNRLHYKDNRTYSEEVKSFEEYVHDRCDAYQICIPADLSI